MAHELLIVSATNILFLCVFGYANDNQNMQVLTYSPKSAIDWGGLKSTDPKVRKQACLDLVLKCQEAPGAKWPYKANPEIVSALIEMLRDTNGEVRDTAGTCLLNIEHETKIPKLIASMKSPDAAFRYEAIYTLGRIGHGVSGDATPAIKDLIGALSDSLEVNRIIAAWALSRLREENPRALQILASGLKSQNKNAKQKAFDGLAEYRSFRSKFFAEHKPSGLIPGLLLALKDEDVIHRVASASLLGSCDDRSESLVKGLTSALDDSDKRVAMAAAFAFSKLRISDPPEVVFALLCEYLDKSVSVSDCRLAYGAMERLNSFPPIVIKTLTRHLNDAESASRLEAACLLSRCPSKAPTRTENVLIDLMGMERDHLSDHSEQIRAIEALGRLGLKSIETRNSVERALDDENKEVRAAAKKALKMP